MKENVFVVFGINSICDYEGEFIEEKRVVLKVCDTEKKAQEEMEEEEKFGFFGYYEICEYELSKEGE